MEKHFYKRALLIILDGFGVSPIPNDKSNAIALANTYNFDSLYKTFPHSLLETSGEAVGLEKGQMGNSEVGHMNIGSGKIIYTDITNINAQFQNNKVANSVVFQQFLQDKKNNRIHLLLMLSDGGVHSHIQHLFFLLDLFERTLQNQKIYIHAFLDGRDTAPNSGIDYIQVLQEKIQNDYKKNFILLSSIIGRFYAMDRNNNWDRTQKAYDLLVNGIGKQEVIKNLQSYIQNCYEQDISDEFMEPIFLKKNSTLQDGDSVFFLNFRADRARQITQSLCEPSFSKFNILKKPKLAQFISFTVYDKNLEIPVLFPNQEYLHTLGELISNLNEKQVRIAETEKYAHVTYFFNCGKETPFPKEKRILIPSPNVKTYNMKPEMSAYKVRDTILAEIQTGDSKLIVANFANGDMVGHTGDLEASIKAVEVLDSCIGSIVEKVTEKSNIFACITADHGNCEKMKSKDGKIFTQHTTFPVPFILVSQYFVNGHSKLQNGILADIAPTILDLLNIPLAREHNFDRSRIGKTLIKI